MNATHTVMLLMTIALAVIVSCLTAGTAFAIARWSGTPVPEAFTRSGKTFATTLMVLSTMGAVVLASIK